MAKCDRCDGTGWANAARDSGMGDMPLMLQPLGVYRCDNCGGRGDTDPFARLTDAQRAELEQAIKLAGEKVGAGGTAIWQQPLQKLGARLAELLDEDQFAECEALLLAAGVKPYNRRVTGA